MTTSPAPAPAVDDRHFSGDLAMDAVTLRVGDLELMSSYYENALALQPIEERARVGGEVHRVLGRGGVPFVRLVATPGLPGVDPRQAGLFHTAFLFEDEASLAGTVLRAAQDPRSRFAGSSDHLVSEAFYFTDPEGNGIELYRDRPRDRWQWTNGQVAMDTLYLDPNTYLTEHLTDEVSADPGVRPGIVGHVHLQVGDVETARRFYIDTLGFETTVGTHPGALFAAAGGYHHHVAMNTWNSRGAGPRAAALGLADVAITVPGREDLDALVARLSGAGVSYADSGRSVSVQDPWGTPVTVSLPGTGTEELLAR
ncbi:VOC family protein [Brachybacterium saurashtrense]|uniref:VOC family protein n=1 Tax=Brachybacterium saurashtrense TaxID=556288 RepID=A0A345YSA2_9MICO|nr:VOC family protein [Brachybacterium saurashtrense]AXK46804.1 VOC family protein [Brachybacterium saurashtrense]RRR22519.1 VOC family protein [Brachybacterium saurashtrense]